jgi:hypothetical protein
VGLVFWSLLGAAFAGAAQEVGIPPTSTVRYGFIDATGKMVIPAAYEKAYKFSAGLAAVKTGDKWGFIDKTGKMAIEPRFAAADFFSEGLARVRIGQMVA